MDFRIKPHMVHSNENIVEVWDNGKYVATIYVGDFPRSLLIQSKYFSHAVFDRDEQPEKLVAHFKDEPNDPAR